MEGVHVGKSNVTVAFDPNSFGWEQQPLSNKKKTRAGRGPSERFYNMKLQALSLPNSPYKLLIMEDPTRGPLIDTRKACNDMGLRWRQQAPRLNLNPQPTPDALGAWVTVEKFSRWLDGIKVGQVKEENRDKVRLFKDWHRITIDKYLAEKNPPAMEGTLDFTPAPRELSRLEILQMALAAEEERLKLEAQQPATVDSVAAQLMELAEELKGGGDATR